MANKTVDMRMRDTITLPTNPTLPPFPPFPKCGEIDRGLGCSTEGGTGLTTEEFLQNMAFPLLQQEPVTITAQNTETVAGDTINITNIDCSRTVLLNVSKNIDVTLNNATKQGVILTLINTNSDADRIVNYGQTVPLTIAFGSVVILIWTGSIWKQLSLQEALTTHEKLVGTAAHGATIDLFNKEGNFIGANAIAVRDEGGKLYAQTTGVDTDPTLTNKSYVDGAINGAVTPISTSLTGHINTKGTAAHGATMGVEGSAIAVRNDSGELLANTLDTSADTVLTNKSYVNTTIANKTAGMLTGELDKNNNTLTIYGAKSASQ